MLAGGLLFGLTSMVGLDMWLVFNKPRREHQPPTTVLPCSFPHGRHAMGHFQSLFTFCNVMMSCAVILPFKVHEVSTMCIACLWCAECDEPAARGVQC